MIRYSLRCAEGHSFDSWFKSADAFEALHSRGMLSCAVCGTSDVSKAIMAPNVSAKTRSQKSTPAPGAAPEAPAPNLSAPNTPMEEALSAFRKHLDENSTYVGGNFASEARKIHLGESPERLIHGEANPEEAKSLMEDGVPVAPLPILPKNQRN